MVLVIYHFRLNSKVDMKESPSRKKKEVAPFSSRNLPEYGYIG